jgi:secondary thiamine-phosphate synthase enzyme
MKIYNEYITLQTEKKREFVDITPRVKSAIEKSGFVEGIVLVGVLHSNAGIIVNDSEPGLLEDVQTWLDTLAPVRDDYQHSKKFESNASIHFQTILLNQQAVVGFTERRLDLGPWQFIQFVELDGTRPKRVLVKVMGE